MSAEQREVIPNSKLFPIDRNIVQNGINWLSHNAATMEMRRDQMSELKEQHPSLHNFIRNMSTLRDNLIRGNPNLASYDNGALFMLTMIKNQHIARGKEFCIPKPTVMSTFILDLLDQENRNYEIEKVTSARKKLEGIDLTPQAITQEVIGAIGSVNGDRLKQIFIENTSSNVKMLFENEPLVGETLGNKVFIRQYGLKKGTAQGASDMYGLFNTQEQMMRLERMWNVKLK